MIRRWFKRNFGCGRSMQSEIRWTMLVMAIVMIIIYSWFLRSYFHRGLEQGVQTLMLMEARTYESQYPIFKDATPLPKSSHMQAYRDWEHVPDIFKHYFPLETHKYSVLQKEAGKHCGGMVALLPYQLANGKSLYLTYSVTWDEFTKADREQFFANFRDKLPLSILLLLATLGATYWIGRRMSRPARQLQTWAENLTLSDLKSAPPTFTYHETNTIAQALHAAFTRVGKLVEREHYFLRHASHELRTPIAVTRANLELLKKVGLQDKQAIPFKRLQHANKNMQLLTETLLWSSRETTPQIHTQAIHLNDVVTEQAEDLSYLLEGKQIELTIHPDEQSTEQEVALTPLNIVLANLIRNAFQHTYEGTVTITVKSNSIHIENCDDQAEPALQNEESFGLGLLLVQELCERLDWTFTLRTQNTNCVLAIVELH